MIRPACLLVISSTIGWLSIASSAVAGDHSGAQLALTCAACHRLDGHIADDQTHRIPLITGFKAETLASMMRAFQQEAETDHIMHTISLQLSNDEINAVASYLANLGKAGQP